MTALVWRGKCLQMRPGRGSFRGVACWPEAKPASSGAAGNTADQYRLKPLQREVVRPIWIWNRRVKNGNSGLISCRDLGNHLGSPCAFPNASSIKNKKRINRDGGEDCHG